MLADADWFFAGTDDAAILAALLVGTGYTILGVTASRLRVTLVGIGGLVVTVPMTFTQVLGLSPEVTAGLLLPAGIALVAWAILASRRGAGHGAG